MKIRSLFWAFLILFFQNNASAQVGIGTTLPNAAAQLDVTSSSKGFLPPRMTYEQRQAITSPPAGLIIWCSDCAQLQIYSGTAWTNLVSAVATGVVPTLTATTAVSSIETTTATSGGYITTDGGAEIITKGICWSTISGPTIALNTKTTDGTGTGSFTSSISGLNGGTTYYVRAYATNSSGTAYGAEVSFTTTPSISATTTISSITINSAASGGNVVSYAGELITARGVCWSTSSSPTVALSTKTTDGIGSGTFTSALTGLNTGTTYYVRAYATNGSGTGYGTELSFTTTTVVIGESYQGGKVAYMLQSGDPGYVSGQVHGFIAAASDHVTFVKWSCEDANTFGADGTVLGTGSQNTLDIIAGCSLSDIAAKVCSDLTLDGYTDWYLPSKDELNKLYINRVAISGFKDSYYWSSSEASYSEAWYQNFVNGSQLNTGIKLINRLYVRAIRTF